MTNAIPEIADLPDADAVPLPFSWEDLPRRQGLPGGYAAISEGARWSTVLTDGREVWLTALHQYKTYAGVLCGLPETDEVRAWPIEGAVRTADQLFQCEPSRIVVLPPELVRSTVTRMRGRKKEAVEIEFLPAVCSIATFESSEPAASPDADASEVVVVWFQGAFGPPDAGYVTECIRGIAWERFASDWHVLHA